MRISGKDLPKPLKLTSSSKLHETQEVYVVGFPFGKKLGANVSVNKSSVSSLRKEHGFLKEVQLHGGVHPGNSGGPVVDTEGQLVGIAVAAVAGTTISFAIPSDHVAGFLMGKLNDYGTDLAVRDGDKIKILYHLNFVDPLGLIKSVRIETFQGPRDKPHPLSLKRPEPRPGETEIVTVDVPYERQQSIAGELLVEPLKDPKFVYWFRPVYLNGAKKEFFCLELAGMNSAPAERKPITIKFQPYGETSCLELTNDSAFRIRSSGGQEESHSLLTKLVVDPTYIPAAKAGDPTRLLWHYMQFSILAKKNGEPVKAESEFKLIADNVVRIASSVELDSDGTPLHTSVDFGKSDAKLRGVLQEFNEHLLESLDLLLLSIPEGEVQPLQTFRVRRNVAAGMPEFSIGAEADLKFQYQGIHVFLPKQPAAIFTYSGTVRPPRGTQANISGLVFGRIEVNPKDGVILQGTADVKVDVDLSTARGITRLTGTLKSQLKPPTRDVPMHHAPRAPGRRRRRRARAVGVCRPGTTEVGRRLQAR